MFIIIYKINYVLKKDKWNGNSWKLKSNERNTYEQKIKDDDAFKSIEDW